MHDERRRRRAKDLCPTDRQSERERTKVTSCYDCSDLVLWCDSNSSILIYGNTYEDWSSFLETHV